jgi:hypothetical protein
MHIHVWAGNIGVYERIYLAEKINQFQIMDVCILIMETQEASIFWYIFRTPNEMSIYVQIGSWWIYTVNVKSMLKTSYSVNITKNIN